MLFVGVDRLRSFPLPSQRTHVFFIKLQTKNLLSPHTAKKG